MGETKRGNPAPSGCGLDWQTNVFFVSHAQMFCTKWKQSGLRNYLLSDRHAPGPLRVKGSLQNSNTFGKAFDCPFINEYSPQVKCEVWWWHRTLTADWALHEGGWTTQLLLSNSRNIKRDKKKTNKYGQSCYWTICSHKIFKRFHDECFIHTWMNFSCVCHLNIALVYLFVTPFKLLNFYIALHFLK